MGNYSYCPVYTNTTWNIASGEEKFERLQEELRKVERYIFGDFIIDEGVMVYHIENFRRKASQGVDVRVIMMISACLPCLLHEKLESMGIKCSVFNPFIPVLSFRLNNRDHRKIAIIDGHCIYGRYQTLQMNILNVYENAH